MDGALVVLGIAVSVVGVVWYHRRHSGAGLVARAFAGALPTTVASAAGQAGAFVTVTGVVRAGEVVPVSEATGRDWVVRDLRLRPFDGASSSSTRSAGQAVDFLLDDDTGIALVRTDRARVVVERDVKAPETTLDRAPWAAEILRQAGYVDGSPERCRVSVWEGVLAPGDRVEVAGTVAMPDDRAIALGAQVVLVSGERGAVSIRRART